MQFIFKIFVDIFCFVALCVFDMHAKVYLEKTQHYAVGPNEKIHA